MAGLHKKIIALLKHELPDFDHALEKLPGGRVSGVVISSAFDSIDHKKRQQTLFDILSERLTAEELTHVGAIATLTAAESTLQAS